MDKILAQDCKYISESIDLKKFKNKKILVIGGNGFFATYVQAVLTFTNCKIISISKSQPRKLFKSIFKKKKIKFLKIDLKNQKKFEKLMKNKFDYIFHFATYGQPKKWMGNEWGTINLNTNILKAVLENSVRFKSKVLFVSSASVYKLPKNGVFIDENSELGTGSFFNETIYVCSKILGEKICEYYKKRFGIPVYIARPAHTYGPGQDFNDPRVIPQLLKRAVLEKKIYMHDSGKTVRTWCYIADLTSMLFNIILNGKSLIYNTAGNDHLSIYQIAKIISRLRNNIPVKIKKKKLKYTSSKPSVLKILSRKYKNEFRSNKSISFQVGIKRLIDWNLNLKKIK